MGGRDPERTPMQWDDSRHAGFSSAEDTWLPVAESYTTYNVALERENKDSFFNLYKTLLGIRSRNDTLVKGEFREIKSHTKSNILSYERVGSDTSYQVILNFADAPRRAFASYKGEVMLSTRPGHIPAIDDHGEVELGAFEGIIVRL